MPPLPDVPNTLKVSLVHSYGSDTDVVTRYFIHYTGAAPDAPQLVTFAGDIAGDWVAQLQADNSTFVTLERVDIVDLSSATAAQGSATAGTAGTLSGSSLTADTSFVSNYEINRRYRGGHPRGYWPLGVESALISPQLWDPTAVAAWAGDISAFFGANMTHGWAGAGTLEHFNISAFNGFVAVENPITHRYRNIPTPRPIPLQDPVIDIVGRQRVGSQRRRLGK